MAAGDLLRRHYRTASLEKDAPAGCFSLRNGAGLRVSVFLYQRTYDRPVSDVFVYGFADGRFIGSCNVSERTEKLIAMGNHGFYSMKILTGLLL